MRCVLSLSAVLALVACSAAAIGAQHATSRGSTVVAGAAEVSRTSGDAFREAVWHYAFEPSHLYFVRPRLAIGGTVRLERTELFEGERSAWSAGPGARVFLAAPGRRMQPFLGVSALLGRGSFDPRDEPPTQPGFRESLRVLEGMAGVMYMPTRQVGVSTELFWLRSTTGRPDIPAAPDEQVTKMGVRIGFSAFFVP